MTVDVILVLITLASAVIGTLSTPPRWVKAVIISLAVLASGVSIAKSYLDEEDSEFMKTALVNSLSPSQTKVAKFAQISFHWLQSNDCNRLEYMRISDGVGIFCYKLDNNDKVPLPTDVFTKVVILTNDNLSRMFANDLEEQQLHYFKHMLAYIGKKLGASDDFLVKQDDDYVDAQYLQHIVARHYDEDSESEPTRIMEQIGILGEATFRLVSGFNASGFYDDDARGVRTYYNVRGKEGELVVDANGIERLPNKEPEIKIFTKIANRFRQEVVERILK